MRRRPVRNPDLLHTFATLGAQKALKEESAPKTTRKELTTHDLKIVKDSVKTAMGGGFRQVFLWAGVGYREHWADSIALGIATAREGSIDTDWLFQLKLAVYRELKLDVMDVATPLRTSDILPRTQGS